MQDINNTVNQNMQNITLATAKAAAKTASDINKLLLSLLLALAQKQKNEKMLNGSGEISLKKMYEAVNKGETLKSVCVSDEDYELFKKHLIKQDVLFATTDFNKDDSKMILFLSKDNTNVKNAIASMKAERGLISELPADLLCKNITDGKSQMSVLKNIDKVELELFRHYAQNNKLVFATVPNDDNIKILFEKNNTHKVTEILKKIAVDLTSPHADLIRKQIEYKLSGRQQINLSFEDVKKEFYVVDAKNHRNYLHITPDGMSYIKNGKEITNISRDRHDFLDQCYAKINTLSEPVLLTPQEFNLSIQEKQKLLEHKTSIFPDYDLIRKEMEKIKQKQQELRAWEIKDEKLSLDNGNQPVNSSDINNSDIPYSDFLENEIINDKHDQEELEYLEKFEIRDVAIKKHTLDYYIEESQQDRYTRKETTYKKEEISL